MIYKMDLKDSSDTMTFNLLETPIVDKDIEGAVDNVTLDGNQYTDYLYLKKQYIQKWAIMCPDEYDELRGFYTRQFEEGEVPSYRVYYGANVTRDYTLNGDYFQFNAEGIETDMTLTQLLGNTEQTTYSGKNLLPSINTTRTRNGVTFTHNDDGSISLSGTASADTAYPINVDSTGNARNVPLSAGNYIVSGGSATSPTTVYMQAYYGITGGADRYSMSTFTLEADGTMGAYIYVKSGTNTTGKTIYPMVEQGSTATAYEPYVGGIASPNPDYPQPISTVTGGQNIKVVGKNLVPLTNQDFTLKNVHYYAQGGSLYIDGTSTGETGSSDAQFKSNFAFTLPAGTYTASHKTGLSGITAYIKKQSDNSNLATLGANVASAGLTLTEPTAVYLGFYVYQAANSNVDAEIQLELGSTATAYEPYQGQSYEINLGKNLLDNKATTRTYLGVTLTKNNDGSITLNGTSTGNAQFYLDVDGVGFQGRNSHLGAGTYTLNGRDSGGVKFEINYKSTNGGVLYSWGTFTAAEPFDYGIYVTVTNGTTVNNLRIYPQLERGSQATSYAPYFTPIELAKVGNYQDRIYKDDGKWYIEKQVGKVVLDGTEADVAMYATNKFRIPVADIFLQPSGASEPPITMSDHFVGSNYTAVSAGSADNIMSGYYGAHQIRLYSTKWASLSDFTTWLASNPTTVYYALATPTTTEITDETLLSQLNFLASLYEGENNISLVGTGAQGEMEVFIRDVMSVETDVVPEVPVRLTLTDDGVINACGCRRNVQLTMRETTE